MWLLFLFLIVPNSISYLTGSKEMADQESGHQPTNPGSGCTPSSSPGFDYIPSPPAGLDDAPSGTPNESVPPPEEDETDDNLEGTTQTGASRLKSEIWKHFKKVKVNGQDKAQCN